MAKSKRVSFNETRSSEQCKLVKQGLLKVKFPSGSKDRKLCKAWQSRWVVCLWNETTRRLKVQIYNGQKPSPNDQFTCTVLVSPDGGVIYRSRSRTHPWAFSVAHAGLVLLHLSSEKEVLSQSWMAVMRDALWPPTPLSQLEEAFKDIHRVSLIDDETTCFSDIFGAFGHLYVGETTLSLHSTHWGHCIKEWNLDDLMGVEMIRKDDENTGGVFAFNFKKGIFSHGQSLQFYSTSATSIIKFVSAALKNKRSENTIGLGDSLLKYDSRITELYDLFAKENKMSESSLTADKSHHCIQNNKQFLPKFSDNHWVKKSSQRYLAHQELATNIVPYQEDSQKIFSESTLPPKEQFYQQTKYNSTSVKGMPEETVIDSRSTNNSRSSFQHDIEGTSTSQTETWANLSEDFLNCSISSFVINNIYQAGSSSSDEFSDYTPHLYPSHNSFVNDDDDSVHLGNMPQRGSFEDSHLQNNMIQYALQNDFRRSSCVSTVSNVYAEVMSVCNSKRPSLAETLYEEMEELDDDIYHTFDSTEDDIYIPPLPPPREKQANDNSQFMNYKNHVRRPSTLCLESLSNSIADTLSQVQSQSITPEDNEIRVIGKIKPRWLQSIKGVKKILCKEKKHKLSQRSPLDVKNYTKSKVEANTFHETNDEVIKGDNHYLLKKDSNMNFVEVDYSQKQEFTEKVLNEPLVPFPVLQQFFCQKESLPLPQSSGNFLETKRREDYFSVDNIESEVKKHSCLSHLLQTLASHDLDDSIQCSCLDKKARFSSLKMNYTRRHSKSLSTELEKYLSYLANSSNKPVKYQGDVMQSLKEITRDSKDSTHTQKIVNRELSSMSDYCEMNSILHTFPICEKECTECISSIAQAESPSYINMEITRK